MKRKKKRRSLQAIRFFFLFILNISFSNETERKKNDFDRKKKTIYRSRSEKKNHYNFDNLLFSLIKVLFSSFLLISLIKTEHTPTKKKKEKG